MDKAGNRDGSVSAASPAKRYRAAVADGAVRPDAEQERVIERMDQLHHALGVYRPAAPEPPPSRLLGFWRKPRERQIGPQPPRGLYLHGGVGRGKSMCMDMFFAGAPPERKRRVHFHAFMAEIHRRLHELRARLKGQQSDPLRLMAQEVAHETWLLCFDEFVVNDIADAMILGRFFQALMDEGAVIVATSNFAPEELYKDGLQRDRFEPFIKLLRDRMDVIPLDGPTDYRLSRLSGRPVYYAPLSEETATAMNVAWLDLSDGEPGEPTEIHVHGRRVLIPLAFSGVARFTFADLCDRPLGASDYLAIASRFHTVLVDGAPILGPHNHNEARRFITMIDAFYEHKTKLVLSAAAPPEQLYPTGKGAFEFQRTVSRLMEMQAEDYLARPAMLGGATILGQQIPTAPLRR